MNVGNKEAHVDRTCVVVANAAQPTNRLLPPARLTRGRTLKPFRGCALRGNARGLSFFLLPLSPVDRHVQCRDSNALQEATFVGAKRQPASQPASQRVEKCALPFLGQNQRIAICRPITTSTSVLSAPDTIGSPSPRCVVLSSHCFLGPGHAQGHTRLRRRGV